MRPEDLVLVSVDDHVVEPPDVFERHLPAKFKDARAEARPQGRRASTCGSSRAGDAEHRAERGRRASARGIRDGPDESSTRCARGCYDVHDRVKDMNANGVLGSMCFPSFPQFTGQLFARTAQKDPSSASRSCRRTTTGTSKSGAARTPAASSRSRCPRCGTRRSGRGSAPRRREGLPRDDVLRERHQARVPEHPQRPLGPVLGGGRGARHRRCACTSVRRRRW